MLPHINFLFFKIPSYSLMVLIGAIGFVILTIFLLEKVEKIEKQITNRLLIISIFGFIALVFFAFIFNSLFHSIEKKTLYFGGITWLGGVIGAFPLTIWIIHKFCPAVKGEALKYFNLMIPGIVIAHGFGRIGCFLGGCCYGAVTDSIFGVSFPAGSTAANTFPGPDGNSLPLLPTQLFEALFEFILLAVMLILCKKIKYHFLETYAFSYGVFRFILEFWRADDRGSTGFFFSPSQMMSIILILSGIALILYHKRIILNKLHEKMDNYIITREEVKEEANPTKNNNNIINTIRELKSLFDDGIITEEEFQKKKEELLEKI